MHIVSKFRSHIMVSALFAGLSAPLLAADIKFDRNWKTQKFSLFSNNTYGLRGGRLDVKSDGGVSMVYRALDVAQWGAKSARWSWTVSKGVPATDLRKKGGDDRNLSIYAVFLPRAEAERIKGAGIRKLLKSEAARVLVYVWGGAHTRAQMLSSPYLGTRGKTIVLRGAGTGGFDESVDLHADFKRAFGGMAGALVGLAVSADSDDTDSSIDGSISGLRVE